MYLQTPATSRRWLSVTILHMNATQTQLDDRLHAGFAINLNQQIAKHSICNLLMQEQAGFAHQEICFEKSKARYCIFGDKYATTQRIIG